VGFTRKLLTSTLVVGGAVGAIALYNKFIESQVSEPDTVLKGEERRYPWKYGDIFYQVKGSRDAKSLLLIHGFGPGASSFEWRKNVDALVRAFDAARLTRHELVIVARLDDDYRAFEARWRALGCHTRLRCLELPAAELPAFYRRADLFVNPSLWESFSFQIVEAMACGTPLLASERKAIPEIAGGAADLVDASDVECLAARMSALLADGSRRLALKNKGLARAADFSWRKTAEATLQVYREAIEGRPQRRR